MDPSPSADLPRVTPYLAYRDAAAALRFLCEAFGFEERSRHPMPDGRIGHAELAYAGRSAVWLASAYPEMGFRSPRELGAVHSQVHCYVEDVDAHYRRALAAGATVIAAPEDQPHGDRSYRAVDPEGHRWIFATQLGGGASDAHGATAGGTGGGV